MNITNNKEKNGPLLPVNNDITRNIVKYNKRKFLIFGWKNKIRAPKHNHLDNTIGPPPNTPDLLDERDEKLKIAINNKKTEIDNKI
mgnify:CR=1 FL=1